MYLPGGKIRKLRRSFNEPGNAHELTFCCYRKMPLLNRDRTRRWLIESIDAARKRWDFELWAYVIMPEHAHLLLIPRQAKYDMADLLKAIKQPVSQKAMAYLRKHDPAFLEKLAIRRSKGKTDYCFWQRGGGYDRNILHSSTAWSSVEYLHNNPVRRGLVNSATDWQWSSARYYAGCQDFAIRVDGKPPD